MARTCRLLSCLLLILLPAIIHAAAFFTVLEPPTGYDRIYIERVSADGATIIGRVRPDDGGVSQAFAWRDATGYTLLSELVDAPDLYATTVADLSADGTIIIGSIIRGEPGPTYDPTAAAWTIPADGSSPQVEEIIMESGSTDQELVADLISADGSTIVGTYTDTLLPCPGDSNSGNVVRAGVRYFRGDGTFEPFGQLPGSECVRGRYFGTVLSTYVHGVTSDGSTVVGVAGGQIEVNAGEDIWSPINEAFAYDGSMTGLDNITDSEENSYARAVSSDGSIIFGVYVERNSPSDFISSMVRWVNGSRQDLAYPDPILNSGSWDYGGGLGMCDNGDYIWYDTTVWSSSGGWQSIEELAAPLGIEFDGFLNQIRPEDMSADGNVIIGEGWTGSETGAWRIIQNACPDFQSGENVSDWTLGVNGTFAAEPNWTGNQPPGAFDYARFESVGQYTVSFDRPHAIGGLLQTAGEMTLDLNGETFTVGTAFACGATFQTGNANEDFVAMTVTGGELNIKGDAYAVGGAGSSLTFDDTAAVSVEGSMKVDGDSDHVVGVTGGSLVQVDKQLLLGSLTDNGGTMLVSGSESELHASALMVGDYGMGDFTAEDLALVQLDSLFIGYHSDATGNAVVRTGATVNASLVTLGFLPETNSSLSLENENSLLQCAELHVGLTDSATVAVSDSAILGIADSSVILAGFASGGSGDISVQGVGSTINARTIGIGVDGLGDLRVLNGASVGSGGNVIERFDIASDSSSGGSVLVSGDFAQLLADTLTVGIGGVGILQCDPTGYVQINDLYIGPLGNIIGNVLAIDTFSLGTPKASARAAGTGFVVQSLTAESGATLTIDTVILGPGGSLGGSGEVALDLTNDGSLAPGDSVGDLATFTVSGNYTQTANGELAIELGESGVSDLLAVSGTAAIDGALTLSLAPGYTPELTDSFTIATAVSFSGNFSDLTPPVGTDVAFTVKPDSITVRFLSVTDVRERDDLDGLPQAYALQQNYPNPFNPTTEIQFAIPEAGQVRLDIFNMLGRRVKTLVDQRLSAGSKVVTWDGTGFDGKKVASGIYLYRLTADGFSRSRKMMLLK